MAYGTTGGKDLVLQLFIDDGVASRGHRANIMKPEFTSLGTFSSTHVTYRHETVFDYAGGMTTNGKRALVENYKCDGDKTEGTQPAAGTPATTKPAATPTTDKPAAEKPAAGDAPAAPEANEKKEKIMSIANDFFTNCDKNKDSKLSWREFRGCLRTMRKEVRKPMIEELRWKMKHINKVGMMVFNGSRKYGWKNKSRGCTLKNVEGYLNESWDEVEPVMNQQFERK